jgi:hypothetical protein
MFDLLGGLLAAASHDQWSDTLLGLDANQRFVVILTALGCVTGIIITIISIAYCWIDGASTRRIEMELKRELLDRGMSADDIAKIIEAKPPSGAAERWAASWGGWGRWGCHKK